MNRAGKRIIVVLTAALLLSADAAITWKIALGTVDRAGEAPAFSEAVRDPMAQFRLEREQLRSRQEAQLNDIIHSEDTDAQIASRARQALLDLLEQTRVENVLEGVLQSRGFEDALASVSSGSANVLVRGEALTQQETAIILDLVLRETGLTGGNVKIIPVK